MPLLTPTKKRSSLESIVGKLSKDVASEKVLEVIAKAGEQLEETEVLEEDLYLVPPGPCSPPDDVVLSEPVSPSKSEEGSFDEQSDTKEEDMNKVEEKESRKCTSITVHRKRSSLGGYLSKASDHVPKAPMRCDVCGLRVYKSYRYISRTSAPLHLKSFVTPNVERFRVCKRCFSSRERCRQNLALILLKSKTSQMNHLRTPLGVTDTRSTKGIRYIVRDLKDKLKRPYDDLMCDETLLDEDEMSIEDFDEKKPSKPTGKVVVVENGNLQPEVLITTTPSSKNIGLVTLVRPQSGVFNSTPSCFTLYGEVDNMKMEESKDQSKMEAQSSSPNAKMPEKSAEVKDKNMANGGLSIEINSINNKLTLLDHAYALPPPKSKAPATKIAVLVTKPAKTNDVKTTKTSPAKSAAQAVKEDSSDDQPASMRTCGIVCSLCDKLVTKSYSCYNTDNAPDKVQHLFNDGTKVVKVCRRCCPYKKPKVEDELKVNKKAGKLVKGKLVKSKKISKIKHMKSAGGKVIKLTDCGKGKPGKNENSPQETKPKLPGNLVKNSQRDERDDVRKGTEKAKNSVVKLNNAGSQTMKAVTKCHAKEPKVEKGSPEGKTNSKSTQAMTKKRSGGKEDCKVAEVKTDHHMSSTVKGGLSPKSQVPDKTKMREKSILPQEEEWAVKESETLQVVEHGNKQGIKTESGTQSNCSLIGVKLKPKTNVASAEKDAQASEDKVDSANLKASEVGKGEKEVISKNPVSEMKVDAPAGDVSNAVMSDDPNKKPDATGIPKDKTATCKIKVEEAEEKGTDETQEDQNEEVKQETRQEVKAKEKEGVKKPVKEGKKCHAKETAPLIKIEKASEEKCKDDMVKNQATEPILAEHKPKDKAEIKSEVSSPRRGRPANTPERKKDAVKPVVPTIMTRKRLASLSETEIEASKQGEEPVTKRRALAVLRDRVLKKSADSDEASSQSSDKPTQQGESDSRSSSTDSSEAGNKANSQKSGQRNNIVMRVEGEETLEDGQGSSKPKVQAPIICASCKHRVVKSYRCIQRDGSPNHIKSLYKDADEILRICRRCLKPGQGKFKS